MNKNILGKYFVETGSLKPITSFIDSYSKDDINIYDVLRVANYKLLFWDDHMERLQNSFSIAKQTLPLSTDDLHINAKKLIKANNIENGNIKIDFHILENGEQYLSTYHVKSNYPTPEQYKKGVKCTIQHAVRPNPSAKIYLPKVRDKADKIIEEQEIFETILINHDNCITEGSRSNLFFIKNNELITAPDQSVLKGIIRKQVLKIADDTAIKVHYEALHLSKLEKMEGAFTTGTSRKILPISEINGIKFNPQHHIYLKLAKKLDILIKQGVR